MELFIFVTVLQAIVAAGLVGVVLMQRSEGGGLGIGGSPTGALGARGAADFLSRATKWLAIAFVGLSILLAALAVRTDGSGTIESDVQRGTDAPTAAPDPLGGTGEEAPEPAETPAAGDDILAE